MYRNINRDNKYIKSLTDFIYDKYDIGCLAIAPAKRGYYGETWRLDTIDSRYFVKLVYPDFYKTAYERSFPIVRHLCDHGIDFISKIVGAKDGALYTIFDGAALGVFDWIDGEHIETDATKIPEYQMLAKAYTVPAHGIAIFREDFSVKSADRFFKQWNALGDGRLLPLLDKYHIKIEHRAARFKLFSRMCQNDAADFFITHGDAGGNLIKNGDRYYLVDWDIPVLAPPERDAWCMCGRDWARNAFHDALRQNGIEHTLRPDRLAYYCYHFFFYYLSTFLDGFAQCDAVRDVEDFINGWIKDSIEYADRL